MESQNNPVINAKSSPIHIENWEVCSRMLIHDLLDLRSTVPAIDKLLKFYSIEYWNGAYTMSLPRLKILEKIGFEIREIPKEKISEVHAKSHRKK